jgi:hypothetical protein
MPTSSQVPSPNGKAVRPPPRIGQLRELALLFGVRIHEINLMDERIVTTKPVAE